MHILYYDDTPKITITCHGNRTTVSRCGFYKHNKLNLILDKLLVEEDDINKLDLIDLYLKTACDKELNDFNALEFIEAFESLIKLNSPIKIFEWQKEQPDSKNKDVTTTVEYEERNFMIALDLIASEYGWSQQEIYDSQPEIINGAIQEIIIRQHDDKAFTFGLSELSYDKNGKPISFPYPQWYSVIHGKTIKETEKVMVPMAFMPGGVVIDHEKESSKDK